MAETAQNQTMNVAASHLLGQPVSDVAQVLQAGTREQKSYEDVSKDNKIDVSVG